MTGMVGGWMKKAEGSNVESESLVGVREKRRCKCLFGWRRSGFIGSFGVEYTDELDDKWTDDVHDDRYEFELELSA